MAKRKDITTPANDYLEQLQWQSRHPRRLWPVHYEPKWKYKIVRRYGVPLWFDRIAGAILLVSLSIAMMNLFSTGRLTSGENVFFGIVIGLIITILFFAIKDAAKETGQDSDESGSE